MSFESLSAIVYIVDDDFAIRDSLTLLVESSGKKVRGYESAKDFLAYYDPKCPGCLLLDVRMPEMSGLELQEELIKRNIRIPIIFISGHADIPDTAKAFRAGAIDFLEKPFDNKLLFERIEEAIAKDIEDRQQGVKKNELLVLLSQLTERERQVLQLVISNHSNKESARILNISCRTIDAHRARIMEKLKVNSLVDLMMIAMQCDLL